MNSSRDRKRPRKRSIQHIDLEPIRSLSAIDDKHYTYDSQPVLPEVIVTLSQPLSGESNDHSEDELKEEPKIIIEEEFKEETKITIYESKEVNEKTNIGFDTPIFYQRFVYI